MTIASVVTKLGITEILHFTTSNGALGVLAEKALVPRSQLKETQLLEFIVKNNCDARKDPEWAGHNSMSISRINTKFFQYSEWRHGHEDDLWWCILGFSPSILEHPDVVFVSGNNTWPRAIKKKGEQGLKGMFAAQVPGTYGSTISRAKIPDNVPTSIEGEVLYPGRVPIEYLTHVYFREQANADQFLSQAHTLGIELPESMAIVCETRFVE